MTEPSDRAPYQVMPDCTPEEDEAFDADVAEHGVLVPVVKDAEGNIVDGHRRDRAAKKAGRGYEVTVLTPDLTDAEKRTRARRLNLARRHPTRAQRAQLVREQLLDTPSWSDRQIAGMLGVDHKTVAARRAELQGTGEIPQRPERIGSHRKTRRVATGRRRRPEPAAEPASPHLFDPGPAPSSIAAEAPPEPEAEAPGGALEAAEPIQGDALAPCASWGLCSSIPEASVDLFIVDLTTGDDLPLADLGLEAARMLRPGGQVAVCCGPERLPQALAALGQSLDYRWLGPVIYQHACRRFGARRVAQWQYPLIYFTRRGDDCTRWISDKHEGDTLEDPVEDGAPGLSVRALASLMGDMGEPGEAVVVVGSEALRETVGRRGGRFVKAESNSEGAGAGECQADESGDAA